MPSSPEERNRGRGVKRTLTFVSLLAIVSAVVLLWRKPLEAVGWCGESLSRTTSATVQEVDFSKLLTFKTLHSKDLEFQSPHRRVIFIGDVHGRYEPLQKLLRKLQYDAGSDIVIHTGDFLTKATLSSALDVISFFSKNSVLGVRGNHDQKIVEWRSWIEWIQSHKGGRTWLRRMEQEYEREDREEDLSQVPLLFYNNVDLAQPRDWMRIPQNWTSHFMGEHYHIARALSSSQYDYLLSLPLVLHIPRLHTYVVHAGILPHDPRFPFHAPHQPLAHLPKIGDEDPVDNKRNVTALRWIQEKAVLKDVPQNADNPWVLTNMRGVLANGTVTKKNKLGEPWSVIWNAIMELCDGYDDFWNDDEDIQDKPRSEDKKLPCYPSTVVYGHAATRGLDIKNWSKGLDTGCTYGRQLTALVLNAQNASVPALDGESITFGTEDNFVEAKLINVECNL